MTSPTTQARDSRTWSPDGIGDLVDAARRAAEDIGSSTEVLSLTVVPPSSNSDLPTVQVLLDDLALSEDIRERLTNQEMLPHFFGTRYAGTWAAEIDDLVLRVVCVERVAQ